MAKLLALILVGFSVGLGNFAAAVAIGLSGVNKKLRYRIAIIFGLFETGMPILGLVLGERAARSLGGHSNIFGGVLLVLTGLYVLRSAQLNADRTEVKIASRSLVKLFVAGLALSIDNLIVGFGLGARQVPLFGAAAVIGVTSVTMSLIGLEIGSRLNLKVEEFSEALSGLILVAVGLAIGFKIL